MLRYSILILTSLLFLSSSGQTDSSKPQDESVFTIVETMPCFPGCEEDAEPVSCAERKILRHLRKNVKIPKEGLGDVQLSHVFVQFTINSQGNVVDAKVFRSGHPLLDQAALDGVNSLPQFRPGNQRGKPVSVQQTVPIRFEFD